MRAGFAHQAVYKGLIVPGRYQNAAASFRTGSSAALQGSTLGGLSYVQMELFYPVYTRSTYICHIVTCCRKRGRLKMTIVGWLNNISVQYQLDLANWKSLWQIDKSLSSKLPTTISTVITYVVCFILEAFGSLKTQTLDLANPENQYKSSFQALARFW